MTDVGETSVPTTTGPLAAHREHSALLLEHLVDPRAGDPQRARHGDRPRPRRDRRPHGAPPRRGRARGRPSTTPRATAAPTPLALTAADHVLVTTLLAPRRGGRDDRDPLGRGARALRRAARTRDPDDAERAPTRAAAPPRRARASRSAAPSRGPSGRSIRSPTSPCSSTAPSPAPRPSSSPTRAWAPNRSTCSASCARARRRSTRSRRPAAAAQRSSRPPSPPPPPSTRSCPGVDDVLYLDGRHGRRPPPRSRAAAPLVGAHGLAATFAHLPVVQGGVRCECGQRGCLATVAAPDVVLERAGLDAFAAAHGHAAALEELVARVAGSRRPRALVVARRRALDRPRAAARGADRRPRDRRRRRLLGAARSATSTPPTARTGRRSAAGRSSRSRPSRRRGSAPTPPSSARDARRATASSPSRCCSPAERAARHGE